jgi:hypothetical protein
MLEEARIEGPGIIEITPEMAPAPAIQLGSFNSGAWADEEEMAAWYARWRLPSLTALPGVVRVRKLISVAGWSKHACLYEFTSLKAREHFVHYEKPEDGEAVHRRARYRACAGSANVASIPFLCLKTNNVFWEGRSSLWQPVLKSSSRGHTVGRPQKCGQLAEPRRHVLRRRPNQLCMRLIDYPKGLDRTAPHAAACDHGVKHRTIVDGVTQPLVVVRGRQ